MKLSVLSRYLVKEVGQAWFAVTLVLVAVLVTNRLVRYLAQAASGNLPVDIIFTLLGLKMLSYLALVLPAAFFLGVVFALGRLYRDSEMAALAACGVGPGQLYRALFMLAAPLAVLVAWLALAVGPWAALEGARQQALAEQGVELEALRPGRFQTSRRADGMFYMESLSADGERMQNVFVQTGRGERTVLISAQSARQERDARTGERYVILEHGYRYEGVPGQGVWRRVEFEEHGVPIEPRPLNVRMRPDAVTTAELLARGQSRDWAELQWRFSMPLMALLLTLVAVPLTKAEPREGRYGKLLAAVLVYVVYSNVLTVAQEWLRDGRLPVALGLWWVHVAFAVVALLWLKARYGRRRTGRRA